MEVEYISFFPILLGKTQSRDPKSGLENVAVGPLGDNMLEQN